MLNQAYDLQRAHVIGRKKYVDGKYVFTEILTLFSTTVLIRSDFLTVDCRSTVQTLFMIIYIHRLVPSDVSDLC